MPPSIAVVASPTHVHASVDQLIRSVVMLACECDFSVLHGMSLGIFSHLNQCVCVCVLVQVCVSCFFSFFFLFCMDACVYIFMVLCLGELFENLFVLRTYAYIYISLKGVCIYIVWCELFQNLFVLKINIIMCMWFCMCLALC